MGLDISSIKDKDKVDQTKYPDKDVLHDIDMDWEQDNKEDPNYTNKQFLEDM